MYRNDIKSIMIDFDGTVVNTIKAICELYNEDFTYYKNFKHVKWTDINTYDFKECKKASLKQIHTYFNQPRFFEKLEFMANSCETIHKLCSIYTVYFVSIGTYPNLTLKSKFLEESFPKSYFIPINSKKYPDKAHVNMKDSILIDDEERHLFSCNAKDSICFGETYPWNENWKGKRMDWKEISEYLL